MCIAEPTARPTQFSMTHAMPNAFEKLCRELGDMTRLLIKPAGKTTTQTTEVTRQTEEKQIDATTTLRRTTIEEIEVKHTPASEAGHAHADPKPTE